MGARSSDYSECNLDEKWSSQMWKSGEMSKTSAVKPVCDKLVIDIDMDSDTATESDLSETGTGRPAMLASSSNSSEWNNDDKLSSQVRKSTPPQNRAFL